MRTLLVVSGLLLLHAPLFSQTVPRLEPAECPFERGAWANNAKIECSHLVVPETHGRANGRTIRLAVAVVRAQQPAKTPLVMLHGGPGDSGLRTFSRAAAAGVFGERDVVIYDQRGAGYSEPRFCPDTADERQCIAWIKQQGFAAAAYNTYESALDLIDLRRALGYAKWDLYGGSYGANLAQEAMRQDAAGIRAVAMEWPMGRNALMQRDAALSAQHAFERVFANCKDQPGCRAAFPNVADDFYADYAALMSRPLEVDSALLDGRRLVNIIRENVLARPRRLAQLPLLLHELRSGDRDRAARTFLSFALPPTASTGQVILHLVNCYDIYSAAFRAARDSVNALAREPFRRTEYEECPQWQQSFADNATRRPVRSDIPTLLLAAEFDDRTPLAHAQRIAETLTHAYVYELPGLGHGGLATGPRGCYQSLLLQFFENPERAPDASCIAAMPRVQFITSWAEVREPLRPDR